MLKSPGFTLVELLIAVSIITILSAFLIPGFTNYIDSQNIVQAQEVFKSDLRTINLAIKQDTDTLQFSVATPYPGTKFYDICMKNNFLVTKDWRRFDASKFTPLNYPEYSSKQIEEVHKYAIREWNKSFIYQPQKILPRLIDLHKREGSGAVIAAVLSGTKNLIKK